MDGRNGRGVPRLAPALVAVVAVVVALAVVGDGTPGVAPAEEADVPVTGLVAPTTAPIDGPESTDRMEPSPAYLSIPAAPPGWTQLPAGPLGGRVGHSAVWTGRELIVWGGLSVLGPHGSGARYVPGDGWRIIPSTPAGGDPSAVAVWAADGLVAFTGDAVTRFDPDPGEWDRTADGVPVRLLDAVTAGGRVVLVGSDPDSGAARVAAYGAGGTCCDQVEDPPFALGHARAVWTGEQIAVIGGWRHPPGGSVEARFAVLDPAGGTWTLPGLPPLNGERGLDAVWAGGELIVVDVDLAAASWRTGSGWMSLEPLPFEPQGCFPRLAAVEGRVFAWYCRQAALLDPAAGEWVEIAVPLLDGHAVSTSCVPVAAGDRVLMWCGNDPAEPFFWEIDPDVVVPASEWSPAQH